MSTSPINSSTKQHVDLSTDAHTAVAAAPAASCPAQPGQLGCSQNASEPPFHPAMHSADTNMIRVHTWPGSSLYNRQYIYKGSGAGVMRHVNYVSGSEQPPRAGREQLCTVDSAQTGRSARHNANGCCGASWSRHANVPRSCRELVVCTKSLWVAEKPCSQEIPRQSAPGGFQSKQRQSRKIVGRAGHVPGLWRAWRFGDGGAMLVEVLDEAGASTEAAVVTPLAHAHHAFHC
jgi:hypothetical protein